MKHLLFPVGMLMAGAVACDPTASSSSPAAPAFDRASLCTAPAPGNDRVDRALTQGIAAVKKRPNAAALTVELGRLWMQKARDAEDPDFYRNVEACADAALRLDAADAAAQNLKGFVLLNAHEFRKARDLAEQLVARDAADLLAWGTLSDALLELGDVNGAERATQRMLDLKPDAASYSRAAYLRFLRGDLAGAKRIFAEALRIAGQGPDRELYAWTLVQAAQVFWHEGDVAGADAGFELALDRLAGYSPALVGRARVALARGQFSKAVSLLERALDRSALVETAWLLGDARLLAGDAKGAERAFARAVELGRHDARTLALFYASKNRNLDDAVRLARDEHRQRPNLHSQDVLAWALYRAGDIPAALELSKQALEWGTPEPRLLFHAGAIHIASGDRAAGRKLVRRALELNATFDPVEAAEAKRLASTDV